MKITKLEPKKHVRQSLPRIERWRIKYTSMIIPCPKQLHGIVYNHEGFRDGTEIDTPEIEWLDEEKGLCQTSNRLFELGKKLE